MDTTNNKENNKTMDSEQKVEDIRLPQICPWCGRNVEQGPTVTPSDEDYNNFIRSIISLSPFKKQYAVKAFRFTFQEISVNDDFEILRKVKDYDRDMIAVSFEEKSAANLYFKLPYAIYEFIHENNYLIKPDTPIAEKIDFVKRLPESIYNLLLYKYIEFNNIHTKLLAESTDPNFFLNHQ